MSEAEVVRRAGGSGQCPMAGTGINKVEHLHSATWWFQLFGYVQPNSQVKNNTFNHLKCIWDKNYQQLTKLKTSICTFTLIYLHVKKFN
jgi:hypothetical protein